MTPVIFQFHGPDGEPLANHEFVVRLPRSGFVQTEDGLVMPELLTYTTDVNGALTVELAPSSSPYIVRVVGEETFTDDCCPGNYINYNFYVPDTATPVRVQDLVMAPPPSNLPYDEEAIIIITDAKAAALAAQAASEAARDVALAAVGTIDETQQAAEEAAQRAAASELQAGVYKDDAGASATAAEVSNVQAGLSKDAAQASATAAGLSEVAAAGSATSALVNKNLSEAARDITLAARDTALNAADESQASAEASALSAQASGNSATASDASADAAALSQSAAAQSAVDAHADRIAAGVSAAAALVSEQAAEASNVASGNSAASALQYRDAAQASATAADTSNTQAQAAATSASDDADQVTADKAIVLAARDVTTTARDTTLGYRDTAMTARDEAVAAAGSVTGALLDGGYINLSGGSYPAKPAFSTFWKVTVGGTVSGEVYGIGDTLVYSKSVDVFYKIDNTENVSSVGGFTGAVTLAQLGIDQTYTLAEKTKLGGVATGATANDTDANLKARANHTGTQLASTISDFSTALRTDILNGGTLSINYNGVALRLNGTQADIASTAIVGFYDSLGVRDGYIGTGSSVTRDMYVAADAGNVRLYPTVGGVIGYHAGVQKFSTTTGGLTVTGVMTATSFAGDGSTLTALSAANINGILPMSRGGTGASTLANAQEALGINKATALGVQDLNTIQTTGWWMQQANSQATLATNYPVAVSGSLTSIQGPSGSMTTQVYVTYLTGETYTRSRYLTTWSEWKKTVNNEFVSQKLNDINAVANTAFSLGHALGFVPQFFTIGYRCKVAELGYAVGDIVYPQDAKYDSGATSYRGIFIKVIDATTVSGIYTGLGIVVPHNTSNVASTATIANWAIEITVGGVRP